MNSKIYILLPVHNRKEITRNFVVSLVAQTYLDFHLVLIDDGSTDGTAEMVREYVPSVTVLRGTGDWWWAGSLQQGLSWLQKNSLKPSDIVLMTNDDAEIDSDFLKNGCEVLKPGMLLQATVYDNLTREILDVGMVYEDDKMLFRPPKQGEPVNCLTTNGLFMRWDSLQLIGGFHPHLLPHYLSDYEFTMRAHLKGFNLFVSPDIKLYWHQGTTGYREIEEPSLMLFLRKFFSKKAADNPLYWTSFVFLSSHLRYLPMHLIIIWKRALINIVKQRLRMRSLKHKRV